MNQFVAFASVAFALVLLVNARNARNHADEKISPTPTEKINHSYYCDLTKTKSGNKTLTWRRAQVGVKMYPDEFCVDINGTPAGRYCNNDDKYGAAWDEVQGSCSGVFKTSAITDQLNKLSVDYVLDGNANYGLVRPLSENIHNFTYVDQYLLSRAFYALTLEHYLPEVLKDYPIILNNLLDVHIRGSKEEIKLFEPYNYTLAGINKFFKRISNEKHNLTNYYMKHFVFEIANPFVENISGFGLYKSDNSVNYTIKYIYTNETYNHVDVENLEVAGYISQDLLDYMKYEKTEEEKMNMKVLIAAFDDNKIFKWNTGGNLTAISRIIAISITNFCSQVDIPLFNIFLKPIGNSTGEWFVIENSDIYKGEKEECFDAPITYMFLYDDKKNDKSANNTCKTTQRYPFAKVNCRILVKDVQAEKKSEFDILTSFSMSINYAEPLTIVECIYKKHDFSLRSIMIFGSALSLIGVAGLILTVLLIKNWHQRRWYSLQLMISMTLESVLFLTSTDISYIASILLYYLILSQFAWMMLIGITQYKKFVKIFKGEEIPVIKSLVIGWLLPLIVIIIPLIVYPDCLHCSSCTKNGEVIIYFVILPTSLVILGNIIIYVLIMWNISKSKCQDFGVNISKRQTRLALLLPFMLGLTWIFLFALVSPWVTFVLIGSYLFHIVAPIQAFVLFIFIVIMDADTVRKWQEILSSYKKNKIYPIKNVTNNKNFNNKNNVKHNNAKNNNTKHFNIKNNNTKNNNINPFTVK